MSLVVQNNLPAINAHNRIRINVEQNKKASEKLSSGYTINRAADNAAGLAISEKMRGQIRGLDQAARNSDDAISLVKTAEGALQETHSILQRMRELTVKSANGTYQNEVDREAIDKELQSLKSEIDRIANYTNYNGKKLLDGSIQGEEIPGRGRIPVEVDEDGNVIPPKPYEKEVTFPTQKASMSYSYTTNSSVIDDGGVSVIFSDLDESAGASPSLEDQVAAQNALRDVLVSKGIKATVSGGAASYTIDGYTVSGGNIVKGGQTIATISSTIAGDGTTDISYTYGSSARVGYTETVTVYPSNPYVETPGEPAYLGNAKTTLSSVVPDGVAKFKFEAVNDEQMYELQNELVDAFSGGGKLTVTGNGGASPQIAFSGSGFDGFSIDSSGVVTKKVDGEDIKIATLDSGFKANSTGTATLSFQSYWHATKPVPAIDPNAPVNDKGMLIFQIGANGTQDQRVSLEIKPHTAAGLGISDISAATRSVSNEAIDKIDDAINYVSSTRADLGALQNRLEHTINNLSASSENLTAAESRISDTDMAVEMMNYTKSNILQQAAQAMLAQANVQPQSVLQLLG